MTCKRVQQLTSMPTAAPVLDLEHQFLTSYIFFGERNLLVQEPVLRGVSCHDTASYVTLRKLWTNEHVTSSA